MFSMLKARLVVFACLGTILNLTQAVMADTSGKIFVAGDGSDNVVVINAHDNSIITTIDTGAGSAPHNIAISPDNRYAWVALKGTGQVAKFDTVNNTLLATYDTGGGIAPVHLTASADGNWLYVNNKPSDEIVKMSTLDGSIAARYTFGGAPSLNFDPHDINLSPDGSQLWVTDQRNASISVLDANLNGIVNTIAVGNNPIQLTFSIDGAQAYVSNYDDNTVSVIDVLSQTEVLAFDMGGGGGMGPMGAVVSPDGSTLWLSGTAGNTVHAHSLTDGGTYAYTDTPNLIGAHGLDISADGKYLYTSIFYDGTSTSRDAIAVIDALTSAEVARFYTPGAAGLHGLAFVAPVPLPATVWLFGSGLLGLMTYARRKKN